LPERPRILVAIRSRCGRSRLPREESKRRPFATYDRFLKLRVAVQELATEHSGFASKWPWSWQKPQGRE
jgi:hypothetical protein